MATQHFKLQNVTCPSCITHLEEMEDDVPGIRKVDANFRKLTMTVEYDESQQTTGGIVTAVSEIGYVATPHDRTENSKETQPRWKKLFH